MFKYPESKYYKLGFLKLILQKIKLKFGIIDYPKDFRKMILKSYSYALKDAKEYMDINIKQFYEYAAEWPTIEKKLFQKNNLSNFYQSWNNKASYCNICCNIINQHIEIMNFQVIASYFIKEGLYIDYGCGTGSLSMGLFLENKLKGKLILLDIPNDVSKFVKYRIKKINYKNMCNFKTY